MPCCIAVEPSIDGAAVVVASPAPLLLPYAGPSSPRSGLGGIPGLSKESLLDGGSRAEQHRWRRGKDGEAAIAHRLEAVPPCPRYWLTISSMRVSWRAGQHALAPDIAPSVGAALYIGEEESNGACG